MMKRKGMDLAVFYLVIIGPLFASIAATIWFGGGSRTVAVWMGFAGVELLLLAPALQLQKFIEKSEFFASFPAVSEIQSQGAADTLQPQITANPRIDLNQYPRKTCFDYSTNDDLIRVFLNIMTFEIRFGKARNERIYVYKDQTNLRAIAVLKGVYPDNHIDFAAFDSSSRVYAVPLGGYFVAQNSGGYFFLARILSIKDDTRGDTGDEVCFAYSIDASKSGRFKAL